MTLPNTAADLSADVLIVGAGLAGGVAARRLAAAGIDVLCVEQGDWVDPASLPTRASTWELAAMGPWHPSPNVRRARADYAVDDSDSEMKPMMFNGVGGSTVLYGAQWMRFLPSDFRTHTLDGVGDDWPISYRDLAPFYDRVQEDFGVSGLSGDPAQAAHAPYPMQALPLSAGGERLAAAHERLGWHWWPGSNAIASRDYRDMRACRQLGVCGIGCSVGAKASTDLTHWPGAIANGARLLTGVAVSRLTHDRAGSASGAIITDRHGVERRVRARVTMLAANAIGTPRLLLSSTSALFPDGLANGSGLVGRRLMMHPFSRAIGFFDQPLQSWQGHWGQSIYSLEFAETRADTGFVRGAKWNLGPAGGPLHAALMPWQDEPLWGEAMHRHVDMALGRSAVWGIICEDLPEICNRVTLHPHAKDAFGNPIPRLHYRLSANSRAMLAYNLERAVESLREAGAHRTLAPALLPEFGWHPLGTCRMGHAPATSVVDAFGQAHEVPNLYLVDGSVLVTGSCANPAATIAALSLRSAEQVIAAQGRIERAPQSPPSMGQR